MNDFFKALKPTFLSFIFMLSVFSLQAVFFSSSTTTISLDNPDSDPSSVAFGLGSPITVVTLSEKISFDIKWGILLLNLPATYLGSVLIATWLAKVTRLQRPARAFGTVAVVVITITFFVSIGISKIYWGYFLSRPALLSEVGEITEVKRAATFKTESDSSGKYTVVLDDSYSVSNYIASAKADSYYCLSARILIDLERRNLLPAIPANTLDGLPDLYPLIQKTGALANSTKGYDSSSRLSGVVVDAVEKSGGRIVFLGFTGGEVSNDHRPYYEMLFRAQKDATELSFARSQCFYYDVAGMEGFEWPAIWLTLATPSIVAGFVIFTFVRLIWKGKPNTV